MTDIVATFRRAMGVPAAPASTSTSLAFQPVHPDARATAPVSGGLYGDALRNYISRRSQRLGLDPNVALSVAPHEGGFEGAIGDQGTSFGPFQLHRGGALPATIANPRQWANSPAGVDYALGQIASTLHGRRGEQGVAAAVREFERPAAQYVGPEIAKALATYRGLGGVTTPAAAPAQGNDLVSTFQRAMGGQTATPAPAAAPSGGSDVVSTFRRAMGLSAPPASASAPASAPPVAGDTNWLQVQPDSTLQGVNPELISRVNELGQYLGKPITVTSGYRSRDEQARLYQRYLDSGKNIRYIAAAPGLSNHERGQALDLAVNGVPLERAVQAVVLRRFGLQNPVAGDLPHTTLLGVNG